MIIYKRTFEAKKYPKGSEERIKLNESAITSEYMTSYKYQIIGEHFSSAYRTKAEAEIALTRMARRPHHE